MSLSQRPGHPGTTVLVAAVLLCAMVPAMAQQEFTIAVVGDGPSDRLSEQHQLYVDELLVLASSEFDVEIRRFWGAWTRESIDAATDDAYADPEVDLVLVLGIVANQLAAMRREFPKPAFLPIILDTGLLAGDEGETTSGIRNLNFLTAYADFANDLDVLARIATYQTLVLFIDAAVSAAIPELREAALAISAEKGIELIEITHDGVDHELMERVPAGADAVIVAGLPRVPIPDFERLVDAINAARLPSYSFIGVAEVERGLLATNSEPRDVDRQARLNALNMQAVMLGERAEDQPTSVQEREKLTINIATARSNLLPGLDLTAGHTQRKASQAVAAGLFAERSTDASVDVSQLIYSDAAVANLAIQKELQRTRLASFEEFQLDVVLAATTSYYTVLNARSQLVVRENNLKLTRANLELAEDRVQLGTSTPADVYRWQAEAARAQIGVMNARAALNQAWDTLNRILHRPQGTRIALREASFEEPFLMSREDIDQLVASPADYAAFALGWNRDVQADGHHDHLRPVVRYVPDPAGRAGALFAAFPRVVPGAASIRADARTSTRLRYGLTPRTM